MILRQAEEFGIPAPIATHDRFFSSTACGVKFAERAGYLAQTKMLPYIKPKT